MCTVERQKIWIVSTAVQKGHAMLEDLQDFLVLVLIFKETMKSEPRLENVFLDEHSRFNLNIIWTQFELIKCLI